MEWIWCWFEIQNPEWNLAYKKGITEIEETQTNGTKTKAIIEWKKKKHFSSCKSFWCLELWLEAFRRHLCIESFGVSAIIIDHVIVSDPIQLTQLSITQLLVCGRSPPIGRDIWRTLVDADCSIPLASPCSKIIQSSYEWCTTPICLNKSTSCCPIICIPQAGINLHSLPVWESNALIFIVAVHPNWYTINVPPEEATK